MGTQRISKPSGARSRKCTSGSDQTPHPALLLQRQAGNQALSRQAVQRDDAPKATWVVPGPWTTSGTEEEVTDRADAAAHLVAIASDVGVRADSMPEKTAAMFMSEQLRLFKTAQDIGGSPGDITPAERNILTILLEQVAGKVVPAERDAAADAADQLRALVPGDEEIARLDQAAEALRDQHADASHDALTGSTVDKTGDIVELVKKEKAFSDSIADYSGKAQKAAGLLKAFPAAKKLGDAAKSVEEANKGWNESLSTLQEDAELAHDVLTALKIDNTSNGSRMMGDINAFKSGIKVADKAMKTFGKAIPIVGTLWEKYYQPLIDMIVKQMTSMAKDDERAGRELQIVDWLTHPGMPRSAAGAPLIDKLTDFNNYFPGGQQVLDWLYTLRGGSSVAPPPDVKVYFLTNIDVYNAAISGTKLTSDWELLDPDTWSKKGRRTNLQSWAFGHIDALWGMQYGSIGKHIPT